MKDNCSINPLVPVSVVDGEKTLHPSRGKLIESRRNPCRSGAIDA
jgi:hypothetical protein